MFGLLDGSPLPARPALEFIEGRVIVSYEELRANALELRKELTLETHRFSPFIPERTPKALIELIARLECGRATLLLDARLPAAEQQAIVSRVAGHIPEPNDRVVLGTSGSTGRPKLVVHTASSLTAAARSSEQNLGWDPDGDRWYLNLPLSHIGGLALVIRCLRARQTIVVGAARSSEPDRVHEELRRGKVSLASFVPTQLARLVRSSQSARDLRLRAVLVGGAPLHPALRSEARERGWPVLATYGLTEMSSQVATESPESLRSETSPPPGHVGRPIPGVTVRVGADGALEVRGPVALRTYLGEPSPLDADGYFRTSDLGSMDESGALTVLGRKDNVLITGGENVSPELVETLLSEVPGVLECCLSSLPDPDWGERLVGVIVAEPESKLTPVLLRRALEASLPSFAIPKDFRFVSELPLLPAGKLDRTRVRAAIARDTAR